MADLTATLFTAISALYTADTGAGGLNESGGSATVRHFVRRGDPNFEVDRTYNWPMVVVEVFLPESRVFAYRRAEANVRMHLYTNRDDNTSSFTTQNAVADRMFTLFDGAALATQGNVQFSKFNLLRTFQAPSSGTELHMVLEFSTQPLDVS